MIPKDRKTGPWKHTQALLPAPQPPRRLHLPHTLGLSFPPRASWSPAQARAGLAPSRVFAFLESLLCPVKLLQIICAVRFWSVKLPLSAELSDPAGDPKSLEESCSSPTRFTKNVFLLVHRASGGRKVLPMLGGGRRTQGGLKRRQMTLTFQKIREKWGRGRGREMRKQS